MTEQRYDFPYECNEGWYDLIEDTLDRVYLIDNQVTLLQVKEKFGGLRIYYRTNYDAESLPAQSIRDLIHEVEEHSLHVCEMCGLPGELSVRSHWFKTLCESHRQELGFAVTDD